MKVDQNPAMYTLVVEIKIILGIHIVMVISNMPQR